MGTLAVGIAVLLIAGNAVRCIWKDKKPGRAVPAADVEGVPGAGRKTDSYCLQERPDHGRA